MREEIPAFAGMEVGADGGRRRHNSRHSIPAKDGISADTDAFADWRQSYVPMARKILAGAKMTFPLSPEWMGGRRNGIFLFDFALGLFFTHRRLTTRGKTSMIFGVSPHSNHSLCEFLPNTASGGGGEYDVGRGGNGDGGGNGRAGGGGGEVGRDCGGGELLRWGRALSLPSPDCTRLLPSHYSVRLRHHHIGGGR